MSDQADQSVPRADVEKKAHTDGVTNSEDEFPEGGAQAWGVAIGTCLILLVTLGHVNSFG